MTLPDETTAQVEASYPHQTDEAGKSPCVVDDRLSSGDLLEFGVQNTNWRAFVRDLINSVI